MEDIWDYARGRVNNKSAAARIGHSPSLHAFRSATKSKGSAASKFLGLLGTGARAALKAIPLPAVGDILGSLQQNVEESIRTWHHKKRGQSQDFGDEVKFTLKELSVDEMDRYRNKVTMAVGDMNKVVANFESRVAKKRKDHATCDAYLELAEAGEQVSRRLLKLRQSCIAMATAMSMTQEWANQIQFGWVPSNAPPAPSSPDQAVSETSVNGQKNAISKVLKGEIEAELKLAEEDKAFIIEYHGKCDKWCCFRVRGQPDNWANFKDNGAKVLQLLSVPFGLEDDIGHIQGNV